MLPVTGISLLETNSCLVRLHPVGRVWFSTSSTHHWAMPFMDWNTQLQPVSGNSRTRIGIALRWVITCRWTGEVSWVSVWWAS